MLYRFRPALAGADADAIFERQDKDFAVADRAVVPRAAPFDDRVDRRLDEIVVDGDLQLDLAEQIDCDFSAAENFGLALLPAEALDVHDRESDDFHFREGGFNVFQFAGLDDGDDEFHGSNDGFFGGQISPLLIILNPLVPFRNPKIRAQWLKERENSTASRAGWCLSQQ